MTSGPRVIVIEADQTHPLRRRVLRVGTPTTDVDFAEDRLEATAHLGLDLDGVLVAVSTWVRRVHPDHPGVEGVQLRGMATDPDRQDQGLGTVLLTAGVARAADSGAGLVWARARDTALAFYLRHGFAVFGRGYTDLTTGLAHHDVILHLDAGDAERDGCRELGSDFP